LKVAAKSLQIETRLLLTVCRKSPAPHPMVPLQTPYELQFTHNIARLAYHCASLPVLS